MNKTPLINLGLRPTPLQYMLEGRPNILIGIFNEQRIFYLFFFGHSKKKWISLQILHTLHTVGGEGEGEGEVEGRSSNAGVKTQL